MPKKRKKTRVKVPIKHIPFYKRKSFIITILITGIALGGYKQVKASKNTQVIKIKSRKNQKINNMQEEPKKKKATFKNDVFKNNEAEIVFTSAVAGTDILDQPIVFTFFNITNKSKEDKSAANLFLEYVEVYQDLGQSTRILERSVVHDTPFDDELDAMNQIIKPNGTIEVAHYGLLVDENLPVSIRYKESINSKEIIGTVESVID